ncbi:hypothetical protein ACYF6T_20205 [Streptomyces sp. 7R007]
MTFLAVVEGDVRGWRIDRDAPTDAMRAWQPENEIDSIHRSDLRTLSWRRANPADARVPLARLGCSKPAAWSAEGRSRREGGQACRHRRTLRWVTDLKTVTRRQTAEIFLVVTDVVIDPPHAAVRRLLTGEREVPAALEDIVERVTRSQLIPVATQ